LVSEPFYPGLGSGCGTRFRWLMNYCRMVITRQGAKTKPFSGRDKGQDLQTDAEQGEDLLADTASHELVI